MSGADAAVGARPALPGILDPLSLPLVGANLIEASAGTGKTYTITTLFVRMLVETRTTVDRILVVTFTEAATAELRERIRARLARVMEVLAGAEPLDDLDAWVLGRQDRREVEEVLSKALRDVDRASIFTIHGFCHRMLGELAFDRGAGVPRELVPDQSRLILDVVQDFWTTATHDLGQVELRSLRSRLSIEAMVSLVTAVLDRGDLVLVPPRAELPSAGEVREAVDSSLEAVEAALARLSEAWAEHREEVWRIVLESDSLNKNKARPSARVRWLETLDHVARGGLARVILPLGGPDAPLDELAEENPWVHLSSRSLAAKTKKNARAPEHLVFDLVQRVVRAMERAMAHMVTWRLILLHDLVDYARREVDRRNQEAGTMGFGDLLRDMDRAIATREGFAAAVAARFDGVFVDEFQDTDPVQYRIFRSLFVERGKPVFLIGDPKQSIYRFRGADVFAYLAAAREIPLERRHTLGTNWRSTRSMVSAVNQVFSRVESPFLHSDITFTPVRAAHEDPPDLDLGPFHALEFVWVPCDDDAKHSTRQPGWITKGWAKEHIPIETASLAVQLLSGGVRVPDGRSGARHLQPEDLAVLVRTNAQAEAVHDALAAAGIPAVVQGNATVFDDPLARDLYVVALAALEPRNRARVRAAILGGLFLERGPRLHRVLGEDSRWDRWMETFVVAHKVWASRGFMAMVTFLMERRGLAARLASRPDGERAVTNLLHLAELLDKAERESGFGPSGLVAWFSRQLAGELVRPPGAELRLDRDQGAIQVVTIHKSKGLQYPVVICPFLWDRGKVGGDRWADRHDPDGSRILDLGSDSLAQHLASVEQEQLQDAVRVAYVALTRAKYATFVFWGPFRGVERSGLAQVIHQSPPTDQEHMERALQELEGEHIGITQEAAVARSEPRGAAASPELELAPIPRAAPPQWLVTSFTGLSESADASRYQGWEEVEQGDLAQSSVGAEVHVDGVAGLAALPHGSVAGTMFHQIMETLDFTVDDQRLREVVEQAVAGAWEPGLVEPLTEGVRAVLETPITPDGPRLAEIPRADRLDELEFTLPVDLGLTPTAVADLLRRHRVPAGSPRYPDLVAGLEFGEFRGAVRGFMDLVFRYHGRFHLVDYKTNFLGERLADYDPKNLTRAMDGHHYHLQYLLYLAALHRYLQLRLPGYDYERDFGAVHYLFVRGMDPARPGHGVFTVRPPWAMVQELAASFQRPGGEGVEP